MRLIGETTRSEERFAQRASLWACLLIAVTILLGGHAPQNSARGVTVLPPSQDIAWADDGDALVAIRKTHAAVLIKLATGHGKDGLLAPIPREPSLLGPGGDRPDRKSSSFPPPAHPAPKPPATGPPLA